MAKNEYTDGFDSGVNCTVAEIMRYAQTLESAHDKKLLESLIKHLQPEVKRDACDCGYVWKDVHERVRFCDTGRICNNPNERERNHE